MTVLENIDAAGEEGDSSCTGLIGCIRDGDWSFDWEQFDQMTIMIILASVCVLI